MRQKMLTRSLIAAGVIAAGIGGYAATHPELAPQAFAASTATVPAAPASVAGLPDFTSLVEKNGPAVVNISVTQNDKAGPAPQMRGLDPSDPFYEFFRRFGTPGTPGPSNPMPMRGLGSGFIISAEGVILTNAHVVDNAATVTVKLTDKREFTAKVLGVDKASDVAVLKIDAKNLPVVTLDKADDVKVGEWVVAIGSPFGFENSVTAGIVSAKSRVLPNSTYVPFLQTDVAVNPGNSGGPLFNMQGEVVGINSQIYSRSGGYQGLSFAIPIDVALNVKNQILDHGSVTRGKIGATIQDVSQALAESFGLKRPAGALVSSVETGGAAAKAGVMPGDVIVRYNGKDVARSTDLPVMVANTVPGTIAKLEVMREGETRQLDVTVGALGSNKAVTTAAAGGDHGRLGMLVRPLAAGEQNQSGLTDGGVIVENVSGPAAKAGIQPGDVILSLNSTPVKNPEQLRDLVSKADKNVALLVQRGGARMFVPVDLG